MAEPRVSADRLLSDLAALAAIGGRPDGGVDRVAGSEADRQARRWVAGALRATGCEVELDALGTVIGRPAGSRGPWLLVGSHTDTVPAGGRLDGAYGVVAALELRRALVEVRHPAAERVAVVDFADEEGVGGGGGVAGSTALAASDAAAGFSGYLELHIEQGPRLEAEGLDLGVVEGIVGIQRWQVRFLGEANHAGTTPLHLRKDAGAAAGRLMAELPHLLPRVDPALVGNAGRLTLAPGAPNVVPGLAELMVELRALEPAPLQEAAEQVRAQALAAAEEFRCTVTLEPAGAVPRALMDADLVARLERACEESGRSWRRLVSGAGHDAGALAGRLPCAMLFVPSRGGVSHSPAEDTDPDHLVLGAQVLLRAVLGFG